MVHAVNVHAQHARVAVFVDLRGNDNLRFGIAELARVVQSLVNGESEHDFVEMARCLGRMLDHSVGPDDLPQTCVNVARRAFRSVGAKFEVYAELPLVAPPLGLVEDETHAAQQLHSALNLLNADVFEARDDGKR
eukprot:6188860-Pleurochrysis_carterae.AAC.4